MYSILYQNTQKSLPFIAQITTPNTIQYSAHEPLYTQLNNHVPLPM
jgi:hypothetical protein